MLNLAPRRDPPSSTTGDVSEGERKLELLLDLGAMIAREVELDELLTVFGERVATAMNADRATLWLVVAGTGELRSQMANLPELDELRIPVGRGVAGYVARTAEIVNIRDAASDQRWAPEIDQRTGYRTRSMLCAPVVDKAERLRGVLQVLNKQDGVFSEADEVYLRALAEQIARALEYTTLRAANAPRGVPLRGRFNHIVGSSPVMNEVYAKIVRAAATDATVLLHGETGTGKGLFSRAIHVNSERRDGPFVHVDCTNLPASLVESELFGHERGAYTGADSRVDGKVHTAAGGTLFLDEIGEMPLELQGKLLRFLQERRFERVGGRDTLESDARIVVATNRDLAEMVKRGGFRSDLYFRVRVIEVELPPLRARGPADILWLAEHFLLTYGRRYGKTALELSEASRRALTEHTWPGNVRELEHAIERAVVLCVDTTIEADGLGLVDPSRVGAAMITGGDGDVRLPAGLPLDAVARRYATATVEAAGGNRSAAARSLGIGRNRLARLLSDD
ncbi:MAG TPA: sigma-54-dependent Fis family transcriptional regulator [Kofleriaceae bacterium]|nr:sigma-54-dependent Fis family transcriptional regulator [Kofleriaceae bacterium]